MGSNPIYNLTWGEYGTSLISAVQLLRCHGELVDVTLAAGGRTFHAHKVVLCAASPFLLDLLKSTTCKHPVVMLAGVQAADLEALLEFVYRGEVSIDQSQLPSLLQAAHCLNIQGLAPSSSPINNESIQNVKTSSDVSKPEVLQPEGAVLDQDDIPKRKKRAKRLRSPIHIHDEKVYIQTNAPENLQNVPVWSQQMNIINVAASTMDNFQNQSIQNIPTSINSGALATKIKGPSDQPGTCPLCGALLRQARNLRRHLVTSCKYRTLNGSHHGSNQTSVQVGRELTQIQSLPQQNIEHIEDSEHLKSKSINLTPIGCSDLISTSNIINIMSNTLS